MNRALARNSLVVTAGIVIAALASWTVAPGSSLAFAVAAIKRGFDGSRLARTGGARPVPSASTVAARPVPPPAVSTKTESAATQIAPRERLVQLRAPLSPEPGKDPFSVSSWLPPPPPPPPPPPVVVPAPTAPPLPFSYMGELGADKGKSQVFLSNGERLLIVSLGDVIDGQYRIDSIATGRIIFTYLPLDLKQVMSTQGEGN